MVAINAIIVRHQSSCKTSPSNATRKAEVISFKATSGLADKRNKNVVRVLWTSQRYSSRENNNYCHSSVNRRDTCTLRQTGGPSSTGSLEQIAQMHALDLLWRKHRDQRKQKRKQQRQKLRQNCAINVHHHDNCRHSSDDKSHNNPRKSRRQQGQREPKQEQRLLVHW